MVAIRRKEAGPQFRHLGLDWVLIISRIGNAFAFTFLRKDMVYNEKTIVFPFEDVWNARHSSITSSRSMGTVSEFDAKG